ncbi:N-acetylmuramoyl-L-alanine amidase [Roseicyclus mahoneyensis]|uniref:N-acetylmuramoyl-L-alanine amidase n=1 Tax=Roseicyclus mahoneyensis TaxID=164332 RepID=A0A316GPE2_9RHOB|nr:N-acetylmuramoyl-L-alanine amidase [Roseicyclus mahoneyensis]PWK62241.1 N-acetylmuramoyl-L-alanine amidase [Roseicyclus mahoneyensis]
MIRAVLTPFLAALAVLFLSVVVHAQGFGALARLIPEESRITADEEGVTLTLSLSQPVPFRVFTLADPMRLVVDFREVAFGDWTAAQPLPQGLATLTAGAAREAGWSRLVLQLATPMTPETAAMTTDAATGRATVTLQLAPATEAAFLARIGTPPEAAGPLPTLPEVVMRPRDGRITVVLDPGHGGVDPGAVRGDHTEADLVLTFARELRDALRLTGRVEVVLTRDADVFVPLPTRVTLARAAGADLFLSIHADALAEGRAQGATIYTLSDTASDAAAEALAEQHDRADLLAGIDLRGSDDVVAGVLMDLARLDTAPRAEAFATTLVETFGAQGVRMHPQPWGEAGFTVLRAADIPSALLEIGFISDDRDLANILDAEWRARMQGAAVTAILAWADADAARMARARQ